MQPKPYDLEDTTSNRNRLKAAAQRGDERAKVTLEHLDQAKHEASWHATEDAKAALAEERKQRKAARPGSVSAGRERLAKAREEKEAKHQEWVDSVAAADAKGGRSVGGWAV